MSFFKITRTYYASWLGIDPQQLTLPGVHSVYSVERAKTQIGHSHPFALYLYITDQTVIISYGEKTSVHRDWICDYFSSRRDLTQFKTVLYNKTAHSPKHDIKYFFTGDIPDIEYTRVRQLHINDYPEYLAFFLKENPESGAEEWLQEYFTTIAAKGYVFGTYEDNQLVCATDAPDIPYLQDSVVEIGITTLPKYRNRGFAVQTVSALLQYLLDNGKTPLYSCTSNNFASQTLSKKLGFEKLADVITISL